MFVATHFVSPMPACTIWYRPVHMHVLEIVDVFTPLMFRRQGVALVTIGKFREMYDRQTLSTATVNAESRGLIIKAGFQQERDGWFLRTPNEDPEYSI